ncbi:MAG: hypothetical protein CSB49_05705 [Proteobacteria bacterium]|nr:MAG: hypothetical protein CSB49_05705 [Pseudomonadota bacterium]
MVTIQSDTGSALPGSMVTINGKAVGAVPTRLRLRVGRYLVEVERPGYRTWRQWLDVKADTPSTLKVKLISTTVAPTTGALLVASDVLDAEVLVDGKSAGKVPALVEQLKPGTHRVRVQAKGYAPKESSATVTAGKTTKVTLRLKPTTELKIVSEPAAVEVWVNGEKKGLAPLSLTNLKAGKHLVEGRLAGHTSVQRTVELTQGKLFTLKLELKAQRAAPATGGLRVTSNQPQALVFIDGRFVGKTPLLRPQVVVGPHVVTVRKKGFAEHLETVEVKAGTIAALTAKLTPGGASQPTSLAASQPTSKPTSRPTEDDEDTRLMNAHSARLVAPAYVVGDVSVGFPHLLEARLTTGLFDLGRVGMDAGVALRTYFVVTEVDLRLRARLLRAAPFSLAAVLALGGGGGPKSRNTFHVDFGAIGTWQYKRRFNVSAHALLSIYTDRLCPENSSENEVDACRVPPDDLTSAKVRKRFTSVRLMLGATMSVPITDWLSVFGGLEVAAAANRRSFTDTFASYMPSSDPHVYGRVGVTLKR